VRTEWRALPIVALLRADSFPASRFVGTFTALTFSIVHFLELSLIPAFFLVRLWVGRTRRSSNAIFIYTMVGSVAMLLSFWEFSGTKRLRHREFSIHLRSRNWGAIAESLRPSRRIWLPSFRHPSLRIK